MSTYLSESATTSLTPPPADGGRRRAVIERPTPVVDGGRFPVKRVVGDVVHVEVDAFADGHDVVEVRVLHRHDDEPAWTELPAAAPDNDRWWADFTVDRIGRHRYTVEAWVDRFSTWIRDLRTRIDAGQDVGVELLIGAELVDAAAERAGAAGAAAEAGDAALLRAWAASLRLSGTGADSARVRASALDDDAIAAARRHPNRRHATRWEPELEIVVDRERAAFSAWYELFPRSTSPDPARHGTLRNVIARLPYVQELGFDVLYLPPIHPIGREFRKGPNNVVTAGDTDPGSPWAIGASEGGHTAINPDLGRAEDLRALVAACKRHGMELALDIAFQSAPDHPTVAAHRDWFRTRPDGTIQYAENPPKKYQDIVPFDFETDDWRSLWTELRGVIDFWVEQGVTIFRVDNPHTKPFAFWEWLITTVKAAHPDVLFLAEAFTRPKPMHRLAKLGFTQSYTYFTWRNNARDMAAYVTELTTTDVREFFRPNFWPNTPDILHADLVNGGRPMFQARFVLAATLSGNYGIYGPAFELGENTPREPGSEEYLDSEKYQQRTWDLDDPLSLRRLIATVNRARHDHPALQRTEGVRFHATDNDRLLAYSKRRADDAVVAVVSFDPSVPQGAWVNVGPDAFGAPVDAPMDVVDLLSGDVRTWQGTTQRIDLDPARCTAALFVPLAPAVAR